MSGLEHLLAQTDQPGSSSFAVGPRILTLGQQRDAVRLLIDMAAAMDYGYFDRTNDTWRCAMCDAPEGHADGCSHGEMLARFAALNQKAGTA